MRAGIASSCRSDGRRRRWGGGGLEELPLRASSSRRSACIVMACTPRIWSALLWLWMLSKVLDTRGEALCTITALAWLMQTDVADSGGRLAGVGPIRVACGKI